MWFLLASCCSITGISGKLDELSLHECTVQTNAGEKQNVLAGQPADDEAREASGFWTVWESWTQQWLIQYERSNLFYRTLALWKDTVCASDRRCRMWAGGLGTLIYCNFHRGHKSGEDCSVYDILTGALYFVNAEAEWWLILHSVKILSWFFTSPKMCTIGLPSSKLF